MKIISIGDIHGRDSWKFHTHGSPYEYNIWRDACEHGGTPDSDVWKEMPFMNCDKIVFIGDYVDSFTVKNPEMKLNLLDIIDLKKKLGDKVVLILGNHDVQYFVPDQICSGYRPEMKHDFYQIFTENADMFTMAYQIDNYIWSHAGITRGWYKELREALYNPSRVTNRFHEIIQERNPQTIAEEINLAWDLRLNVLFNVDRDSGGISRWGGPLWVRPRILNTYEMEGYSQIVGHTPQKQINKVPVGGGTIYYIDCLEYGVPDCLELEI